MPDRESLTPEDRARRAVLRALSKGRRTVSELMRETLRDTAYRHSEQAHELVSQLEAAGLVRAVLERNGYRGKTVLAYELTASLTTNWQAASEKGSSQ